MLNLDVIFHANGSHLRNLRTESNNKWTPFSSKWAASPQPVHRKSQPKKGLMGKYTITNYKTGF